MDALRGSFGTVGSIIRARSARRMSQHSRDTVRSRHGFPGGTPNPDTRGGGSGHLQRHQLYDAPMPSRTDSMGGSDIGDTTKDRISTRGGPPRTPTIKFGDQDVAHYYHGPGEPAGARHQTLAPHGSPRGSSSQQIQRQPSPLTLDLERGPATAPPGDTSFYNPHPSDPFEESPATATGTGFTGMSYDDAPPRRHQRYPSNGGRSYPRTGGSDDREESVSLVHEPQSDRESGDPDGDSESEIEGTHRGGIRLLPTASRI